MENYILIRHAVDEDLPFISDTFNTAILDGFSVYTESPLSMEDRWDWFNKKKINNFPVIMAELNGNKAGFATWDFFRPQQGYKITMEHSVYVSELYRNKSIGSRLLQYLIKTAKEYQLKNLIGVIDAENAGSIQLHRKYGFIKQGELRNIAIKKHSCRTAELYVLAL